MCIVVDANSAHHLNADHQAGAIVLDWLLRGKGKLVVSQSLLRELAKTALRKTILELERAARLCKVDGAACDIEKARLEQTGLLKSNDGHILALVIVGRCDLVFTHDQRLHEDLKNQKIVPRRCSIYQDHGHAHLLGECRC